MTPTPHFKHPSLLPPPHPPPLPPPLKILIIHFYTRLIYNYEAWSYLKPKDYLTLQTSQLTYLRNVLEVSKATLIAAMYLELGILPVNHEIEMRQLLFLKRMLDKKHDPCLLTYNEMLKFENETKWADNVRGLWREYNLPLNDDNIKKMSVSHWKYLAKVQYLRRLSFSFRLNSLQTRTFLF